MFQRWCVRIPSLYTGWTFFTLIRCKICNDVCLKRLKKMIKEGGVGPFFKFFGVPRLWLLILTYLLLGSGCGSVGRVVASDTRGPWFESSQRQKFIFILNICLLATVYWKDENKDKRGREWPIFLKKTYLLLLPHYSWGFVTWGQFRDKIERILEVLRTPSRTSRCRWGRSVSPPEESLESLTEMTHCKIMWSGVWISGQG